VRIAVVLGLSLAALAAAGCGSPASNGEASRSVPQILASLRSAVASARSVRVVGSVSSGATQVALDLALVAGVGAAGTLSENGLSARIVRIGSRSYLQAGPAFWHLYLGANGRRLAGRWIEAPARGSLLAALTPLTTIPGLVAQIVPTRGLRKQRMTTVKGRRAFTLVGSSGGELYIAATGPPYPLIVSTGSSESGRIRFEGWDAPYRIVAPRGAIPLQRLTG
jgi:hypothetical protein